ncbi:MAG TPA: endolytic transglycosylase MltG [Acidimicrobiales bacterium]|nr:endolytic transglycosylase MltG [Acidimicrobiales bacterium]
MSAITEETDEEYESFPEDKQGRSRMVGRVLLGVAVVGLLVIVVGGLWLRGQIDPGAGGNAVQVSIPKGATTSQIADLLDDHGVIKNAGLFRFWVKFKSAGPFQAGDYQLRVHQRYDDVIAVLQKGAKAEVLRLTIPEGFTLAQIAERVGKLPGRSAQRFLDLAASGQFRSQYLPAGNNNLEGMLFPETYDLRPQDDEAAILRRLVSGFDQLAAESGIEQSQTKLGLTPYEVVIVASMIEREARVPDDRAMIARVIYNRIQRKMPLGIDATIRYALNKPSGPLRQSELAADNPYNTRKRSGLPPTPIASPGRAALEAALNPAPGGWLYYVLADQDGRHVFATTDAEFQKAVANCKAKGLGC